MSENNEAKVKASVYEMEKRDAVFCLLSFCVCVAFVILAVWGKLMAGFTASYLCMFALLTCYLYNKKEAPLKKDGRVRGFAITCGIISVIGSAVFSVSSLFSINFFLAIMVLLCGAVWFLEISGVRLADGDMAVISHPLRTVFGKAFRVDKPMRSVFNASGGRFNSFAKVLAGILCALPLLIIVILLLINADAAFEGFVDNFIDRAGTVLYQLVLGAIITPFFISYGMGMRKDEHTETERKEAKKLDNAYICSFMGILCAVYVLYLFSQLAYFFDAFKGILPEGYNASEYARRGFFDMCWVAGINFAVIFTALALSREKDGKVSPAVGATCLFTVLFSLFLIVSALVKMYLYIGEYGLTVLRVTTSIFMIFLFIVFIALAIRCFVKRIPVMKVAVVAASALLIISGFMNVEANVAQHNVDAYKEGKLNCVDVYYIRTLGVDGVPALFDLYENVTEYKDWAYECIEKVYNKDDKDKEIGQWNVAQQRANNIFNKLFKRTAKN